MDRPEQLLEMYLPLLIRGDLEGLEALFDGDPLVDDPRLGRIEGDRRMQLYVGESQDWLGQQSAEFRLLATTAVPGRAVVECVLALAREEDRIDLPVALVADTTAKGLRFVRIYHSMWPLLGAHILRPSLLSDDPGLVLTGAVAGYHDALTKGDLESILRQFEPDGYAREPSGGSYLYRGQDLLRQFYGAILADGGIVLEHCTATDDGVRCALEFNAVRWGRTEMPHQAGVAIYERGPSGLLAAARIYDDVDPPIQG